MTRAIFISGMTLFGLLMASCSNRSLPPDGRSKGPKNPSQAQEMVSRFSLAGYEQGGRRAWEVQGETADLFADRVKLSPVKAISFGRVPMELVAQTGWFDKATQQVELIGPVEIAASDGRMKAVGDGGEGFPKRKRFRLNRQVEVVLRNPQGDITRITCDGPMEVVYQKGHQRVRFLRNVQVQGTQWTIRSDRLDATIHPRTNELEQATFFGRVEIRKEGEVAYAQRLNYWRDQGRMQLMGHPKWVAPLKGEIQ